MIPDLVTNSAASRPTKGRKRYKIDEACTRAASICRMSAGISRMSSRVTWKMRQPAAFSSRRRDRSR